MHLRNTLKKCVGEMGTKKFWVLDGLGAVLGVDSGTDRGGNKEILVNLEQFIAADGVHLSKAGYKNMARVIKTTITSVYTGKLGKQNSVSNTGTLPAQERSYYWRGFISPCGSVRPRSASSLGLASSGGTMVDTVAPITITGADPLTPPPGRSRITRKEKKTRIRRSGKNST
jgi:hypothetical protein